MSRGLDMPSAKIHYKSLKKGGNAGLRPKEHTCANITTVRALTDEGLPTAHGGTGVSRV